GLPRRFLAIERLLEIDPTLVGRIRFVQLAAPSRTNVETYAQFRRQLDELVGRINGRFSTTDWSPIQYLYRSFPIEEVIPLYRAGRCQPTAKRNRERHASIPRGHRPHARRAEAPPAARLRRHARPLRRPARAGRARRRAARSARHARLGPALQRPHH